MREVRAIKHAYYYINIFTATQGRTWMSQNPYLPSIHLPATTTTEYIRDKMMYVYGIVIYAA